MPIESFWPGQTVPFHRTWTADSGDAAGTTATITLSGPLGEIVVSVVTATDGPNFTVDGEYQIPDSGAATGLWTTRWDLDGTIHEARETEFYVLRHTATNVVSDFVAATPAEQLITTLLTVDGPGSGLDADLLDGIDSTGFATPATVGTAIADHVAAPDPHGDQAFATAADAAHLAAVDPHGDRAFATSADTASIAAHSAAADPHADRAFTTAAVSTHTGASDPHGDRSFASSAIATAIANLIASAPGALDTLNELAAALGNDANFATTVTNALAGKQPLDSDLTAIAALSTTSYGRAFLALADAAAARTALALGTAATTNSTAYDTAGAAAAAQAASQPLDSDLTAIAAVATTSFGRALLALADAAAARTALALGTAATSASSDFQPIDSDLTAIAALTTTSFGRSLLELANAAAGRTAFGLGTAATTAATDYATAAHGTDQPLTEYTGTSVPSTPGTGVTMFARRRPSAGRRGFAYVTANGAVIEGQPSLATTNWLLYRPTPNLAAPFQAGLVKSDIGTQTLVTLASATNDIAGVHRTSYISGAGAGASGGLRSTSTYIQRSNGSGRGGFYMVVRFAFASIPATRRWFIGACATSPANVEPSSVISMFGVGEDLGDTSPQFMTNDASGTATKTSSTLADVATNLVYEVRLLSAPNLSTVQMSIERFAAGASAEYAEFDSGVSTDLPAQVTMLNWSIWFNNGSTAAAIDPHIIGIYVEAF